MHADTQRELLAARHDSDSEAEKPLYAKKQTREDKSQVDFWDHLYFWYHSMSQ
jgi:hypothetical protein